MIFEVETGRANFVFIIRLHKENVAVIKFISWEPEVAT